MDYQEMYNAISEAQRTLDHADSVASKMAILLKGRLRKVSYWTLKDLKRELQDFNAHTGKWRGEE